MLKWEETGINFDWGDGWRLPFQEVWKGGRPIETLYWDKELYRADFP